MKTLRKCLFILAVVMSCGAYMTSAQVYVRVRPPRPHVVRVEAPSPRHVWVEEDWEPRGETYVHVGGHWVEPPHPGGRWVPGHWKHRPRGWVWMPGHWR